MLSEKSYETAWIAFLHKWREGGRKQGKRKHQNTLTVIYSG